MPLRYIVLAAASVVVLGALVLLLVEVKASPEIEIPEQALAEARARYERNQAARARPAPRPAPRAQVASRPPPRTPRPAVTDEQPEEPAEPEEEEIVMDPARQRLAMLREKRDSLVDVRARRDQVRKHYEEGNYEMALREARTLIPDAPTNRYVMRVAVTSACALGEREIAKQYYSQLFREEDRRIVRVRCARHGIEL